jgi:hypothetical protein
MDSINRSDYYPLLANLPQTRRGRFRFWFCPDNAENTVDLSSLPDQLLQLAADPIGEQTEFPGHIHATLLRNHKRVRVFRLKTPAASLIAKTFKLTKLKDRFRSYSFALAETANNLKAASLGIPTPRCYLYYEFRPLLLGPVRLCGVLMEDLQKFVSLADAVAQGQASFFDAIPAILQLFQTGVNHIDPSPVNIFLDPRSKRYTIIDWQHCQFHTPFNTTQLVLSAAHFLRYAQVEFASGLWRQWLEQLHQASAIDWPLDLFISKVASLHGKKIHTIDRLTLNAANLGL